MSDDTGAEAGDSGGDPDLTPRQRELLSYLPASKADIADAMNVEPTTVGDASSGHIGRIRDQGIALEYDHGANQWYLADEPKVRRISTKHKGTITREANQFATELEATILRRLERTDPLRCDPDPTAGAEDMVVHMTDLHIGDVVEDERGREVYNSDIAETSADHVTRKAVALKERMGSVVDFDGCTLLWGGDMVTNEAIYDGQAWDVELKLADQLSLAVEVLTRQAKTLAREFDTLQVVAVMGNHGESRASGVSKQANMDLLAYRWVQDRLREAGVGNVELKVGEATAFRNFTLRGGAWRGHLRHGQSCQVHCDATAASSRDWRGWLEAHRFDVAYRGHHHQAREEEILNRVPVIMSPSAKPGADFAEKIGQPDTSVRRKLATIHGVSDDRPVTWKFVVDKE